MTPVRVVALQHGQDRSGFHSGSEALDRYFHQQVTQDIRRRVTGCFVALDDDDSIEGFYTLAAASIPLTDLPEQLRKKLPRYPSVPAVVMGRLAVSSTRQGTGLGGALLYDALMRAIDAEITAYAMLVDAINAKAAAFYIHHGFVAMPDTDRRLMLPLETVRQLS